MNQPSWILFALGSAISAAFVAIFGKIGIKGIDSTLATTVRSIIMAVFLILVSLTLHKFSLIHQIDRKALIFIALAGIAGALSWLFYFYALQNGPVKGVAGIDRLSVAFAIVLAAIILGESISFKNVIGIIVLTIGVLLLI